MTDKGLDDTAVPDARPDPAAPTQASDGSAFAATGAGPAIQGGPRGDLPEVSPHRYAVDGEVGRGGIGRVVRARDVVLDRTVALKELMGGDDGSRRRFVREALITARLQHPSIVPIYEAGRWPDRAPFYAMKLVAGRPLSRLLDEKPSLDARLSLVPIALAVADAIAYAHSERVIHRDLKPHNVLVGEYGETIVIDWGLAKDLSAHGEDDVDVGPFRKPDASDRTIAGAVLGTPAYMPPEQAQGKDVDERADVYALGAMLYHVVAGAPPHTGATIDEMISRIVDGTIVPLTEREPDAPPDLAAIVAKAMERDPARRYRTARELADDLRQFTNGQLVAAHRYSVRERIRRFIRRHRAAVTAGAAMIVFAIAGTSLYLYRERALRLTAEADRARVQHELAIAYANQARAALVGGDLRQALPYLSASYSLDDTSRDVRTMLGQGLFAIDSIERTFKGAPDSWGGWFREGSHRGGGRRILVYGDHPELWNADTGELVVRLDGPVFDHSESALLGLHGNHAIVRDNDGQVIAQIDAPHGSMVQGVLSARGLPALLAIDKQDGSRVWARWAGGTLTELTPYRDDTSARVGAGGHFAVIDSAERAELWDLEAGVRRWSSAERVDAWLSPDELMLAVSYRDGHIELLDTASGVVRATVASAIPNEAPRLSWAPDGKSLIACSGGGGSLTTWDGTLSVIDVASARTIASTSAPQCELELQGSLLLTDDALWTLAPARKVADLPALGWRAGSNLRLTEDGRFIVTHLGSALATWRTSDGKLAGSCAPSASRDFFGVTPDGQHAIGWTAFEGLTLRRLQPGRFQGAFPSQARVSRSGRWAISAQGSELMLWELGSLFAVKRLATGTPRWVAFDPAEHHVAVAMSTPRDPNDAAGAEKDVLNVYDVPSGGRVSTHDAAWSPSNPGAAVTWSPDGSELAVFGERVIDPRQMPRRELALWRGDRLVGSVEMDDPQSLAYSSDGQQVLAVTQSGTVFLIDATNASEVAQHHEDFSQSSAGIGRVTAAAFDAASGGIILGDDAGLVEIWDRDLRHRVRSIHDHLSAIVGIEVSPQVRKVTTASVDGTIVVWNERWQPIATIATTPSLRGFRLATDGSLLAVADGNGIGLWDATNGLALGYLDRMPDELRRIEHLTDLALPGFTPDASTILFSAVDAFGEVSEWREMNRGMRFENEIDPPRAAIIAWDIRPEQRSPSEVASLVALYVRWRLEDGRLVKAGNGLSEIHPR
jgi:WD40 repeat protein